ncbi:MAG: dihydropteroate synthase [Planctomycetia bacterium]|nr:dihydropteroate synthase [Planctomycetia bacterium]
MGIVNVTPDSFSDGGKFFDPQAAVDRALRLIDDGADLIDIGGESTRPYSQPVDEAEELRRVRTVIEQVVRRTSVPVSIDTSKPAVARACLDAGAEIVNDITGLADPAMVQVVRDSSASVCVMHMQGNPQTMQDAPTYDNVVEDIKRYLAERLVALTAAGIDPARIVIDPGIGFGKTHQHNLTLLANCWQLHTLGRPLLVGHSRKGFIGKVLGDKEADRTAGTIGVSLSLAQQGVQILRVHDVRPVREALLLFAATGGLDGQAAQVE